MLTNEVNATLLDIRSMAQEQGLAANADDIVWGRIPLQE
jgi:hypothetical protein